jgi:hypothetical protein
MSVDVSGWKPIGVSSNADFYEIEPQILAVVPFEGATDNAATARESVAIQLEHLRGAGVRAGVVVFMDRVIEQDSGARAVYRDAPDPTFQECFALVGGTPFGRAVGSLFIGLSPPKVPTRMFATLDDALRWIRERLARK